MAAFTQFCILVKGIEAVVSPAHMQRARKGMLNGIPCTQPGRTSMLHGAFAAVTTMLNKLHCSHRVLTPACLLRRCRHAAPREDPLRVMAQGAAASSDLLCLDELHVTDVADAMLLSRLFEQILAHGCMVCFTSNRPVRDLYKGGLSRKYFEPFIQLLDERLLQLKVAGGRDYRTQHDAPTEQQEQKQHSGRLDPQQQQSGSNSSSSSDACTGGSVAAVATAASGAWLVGAGAEQQLQQHWQQLADQLAQLHSAAGAAAQAVSRPVSVSLPFGRKLWVPRALLPPLEGGAAPLVNNTVDRAGQQQQRQLVAARFEFEQLCGSGGSRQSLEHAGALSANDYVALVRACPVLFVSGLPQLTQQQRDEARRLVTFLDVV
eukprot:GHRQ01009687.1.p1 GENE.GHRQ01009687.1~~GHRQ01009687.1.p1  ORF type:complete len:376 (+),score=134.17 GHRQ01009687.1:202-1329(+)